MSVGFKQLVTSLQGVFSLVANFLENPMCVISQYDLTDDEKKALLSRNFDALASLCGSQQMAAGVLSGAHSAQCSNRTVTRAL